MEMKVEVIHPLEKVFKETRDLICTHAYAGDKSRRETCSHVLSTQRIGDQTHVLC